VHRVWHIRRRSTRRSVDPAVCSAWRTGADHPENQGGDGLWPSFELPLPRGVTSARLGAGRNALDKTDGRALFGSMRGDVRYGHEGMALSTEKILQGVVHGAALWCLYTCESRTEEEGP